MAQGIIYLAKAGTGKTTFITSGLKNKLENKNVLYITYTNMNAENLKNKLQKSLINFNGYNVLTFYEFMYRELIKPYSLSIEKNLQLPYKIKGVYFREPGVKNFKHFISKASYKFWENSVGDLYGDKLAALLTDIRNKEVFESAIDRLSNFYDYIIFDEFQDVVNPELHILNKLSKSIYKREHTQLILVGDLYQSCVTKTSKKSSPYDKFKTSMSEEAFTRKNLGLKKTYLKLDQTSLNRSFRVPKKICDYIRTNLKINIYGSVDNEGEINVVNSLNLLKDILMSEKYKLLTYDKRKRNKIIQKYGVDESRFVNYGESKGLEYDNIAIFLTEALTDATNRNNFSEISSISKNKFYVALTRTKNNVYLIPSGLPLS